MVPVNVGTSLVPLIVTVMVSVTVSPTSSSAVTSYSKVMESPTSKKSKSKSCTFNVQVAVFPSVVMENAASKAWRKSAYRVTPLLGVTVAEVAPVIDNSVLSPSSKMIVPLATKSWADASTSSLKLGSTAGVSTEGRALAPLMVTVKTAMSVSPLAS